jgi:hypothetical protein
MMAEYDGTFTERALRSDDALLASLVGQRLVAIELYSRFLHRTLDCLRQRKFRTLPQYVQKSTLSEHDP